MCGAQRPMQRRLDLRWPRQTQCRTSSRRPTCLCNRHFTHGFRLRARVISFLAPLILAHAARGRTSQHRRGRCRSAPKSGFEPYPWTFSITGACNPSPHRRRVEDTTIDVRFGSRYSNDRSASVIGLQETSHRGRQGRLGLPAAPLLTPMRWRSAGANTSGKRRHLWAVLRRSGGGASASKLVLSKWKAHPVRVHVKTRTGLGTEKQQKISRSSTTVPPNQEPTPRRALAQEDKRARGETSTGRNSKKLEKRITSAARRVEHDAPVWPGSEKRIPLAHWLGAPRWVRNHPPRRA